MTQNLEDPVELLLEVLRRGGHRVTSERVEVFDHLLGVQRPTTRSEIATEMRGKGIHAPTVYRTIDLFVALGVIQPMSSVSGDTTYELLPPFASHHHHFRCLRCGVTLAIDAKAEEKVLREMEDGLPGVPLYHQMDIFGNCFKCLESLATTAAPSIGR